MNVLLTGGGTGGHVYPALAVAEALRALPQAQPLAFLFVGTHDRLEAKIVPEAGIPFVCVTAAPLQRRSSFALVRTLAMNALGVLQALSVLHRFRPDCVVATGGYVTFPVVAAMRLARALRLTQGKIALLEPNARPGLTNRLLEPLVDEIWVSYGEQHGLGDKSIMTGTPVRASFSALPDPRDARARLGLDPEKTTIVVIGGSQGAHSLNAAVAGLHLSEGRQLLLLTGRGDQSVQSKPGVVVREYLDDMPIAYAAADAAVTRAGASTLAELAATRTPAILVPYPHATDAHQMHNAARFVRTGAARMLLDRELAARLQTELEEVLEPKTLADMRRAASSIALLDASERTARRVVALVTEKRRQR
jgi:UDP-N-acetylglucosamine--N-acetylmuramyl-(pentapeptide) pyrophosphoryl-undecaprenol N-acetylglucosamine transferase